MVNQAKEKCDIMGTQFGPAFPLFLVNETATDVDVICLLLSMKTDSFISVVS